MHPQYHTVIGRIQTKGWGIHPYCHQASRLMHAIRRDLPILSENPEFSRTEHLLDLRPVCKFEFIHCGPVKNTGLYLSLFSRGALTFENSFFQTAKLRFSTIFDKILRGRVKDIPPPWAK